MQGTVSGTTKQVIVDLIPMVGEHHLLAGLKEKNVASLKKNLDKRVVEKDVKEVGDRVRRANPPSSSTMCSTWITLPHRQRVVREQVGLEFPRFGITIILMAIVERIERVEAKVERAEEMLGLFDES